MSRVMGIAVGVAAAALAGCNEARREAEIPIDEPTTQQVAHGDLPEALMVRFETVSGSGFSREGWELEVLQMGGDIRVRGAVRRKGSAVPVFRPMDAAEFAEFWQWIEAFPLDGYQVKTDQASAEPGWRRRLKFDAVVGPDRRILCDNEWTRPAVGAPWLSEIENRLHDMVVELAERELAVGDTTTALPEAAEAMQRAIEALGQAPPPTQERPQGD